MLYHCVHNFPQVRLLIKFHLNFPLHKAQVRKCKPKSHFLLMLEKRLSSIPLLWNQVYPCMAQQLSGLLLPF